MSSIENSNFEENNNLKKEKEKEKEEKLIKNVKILKEIPEDTTNPDLIIKLDNLKNELKTKYKFSLIEDEEGRKYFIAVLVERKIGHGDTLFAMGRFYKKNFSRLLDGGFIDVDIKKNKLIIKNFSDNSKITEITEKIFKNKFPDIGIKIRSLHEW